MLLRYTPAQGRRKLGHITPSCNTVLEPLTVQMGAGIADQVSHHFTRITVEEITLQERHLDQFTIDKMLTAATLLADAAVDGIVWNGTSGAWNGLEADVDLCRRIAAETDIPASTTILAQVEAMERLGLRRYGLAVPYTDDVAARIVEVYAEAGLESVALANAGLSGGREMAYLPEETVRELLRSADSPDADCLLLICTGVAGAQLVQEMEQELGKPIVDSVAVTLWKGLELVGVEPRLEGWGSLFAGSGAGQQTAAKERT